MHSILIPTYQREDLIKRCITSLLNQTHKEFQAIIIDDGSTDNTKAVFDEMVGNDKRFEYIYQEKANVSKARNNALQYAKGEWISFLDSDDEFTPNNLEIKEKYSKEYLHSKFFVADTHIIGDQWLIDRLDNTRKLHISTVCPNIGRWWIKKDLLEQVNGFDETINYSEDSRLMYKLVADAGVWPVNIFEKIYVYYRNGHPQLTKSPNMKF